VKPRLNERGAHLFPDDEPVTSGERVRRTEGRPMTKRGLGNCWALFLKRFEDEVLWDYDIVCSV